MSPCAPQARPTASGGTLPLPGALDATTGGVGGALVGLCYPVEPSTYYILGNV